MPMSTAAKRRYMRIYNRAYNRKHRAERVARNLARIKKLLAWVRTFKKACVRCGESHLACLDFHHLDPAKKTICIAHAVRRQWSKDRLLAEMAKCVVLCANCHRKETIKID